MTKTAELPEGRNHAGKHAVSSTLVSTALIEGESLAGSSNQKQIKRLTKTEFAYKLSKGKCLKCDQNFTPEHRCASRTLQILLADKENENDGVANMDKLSYNTLLGLYENYTMRLWGILGGEETVVLIDCGASNNIISANVVKRLGIKVTDTVAIDLNLANGETISNKGICKGVVISFPELQVVQDFLQLKMGNTRDFDVILGIQWLKTLGDVMVNWKLFTMTFGSKTGKITLKGDPDLCSSSRMPAKSMEKSSKIKKNPLRKLQLFFYSKFCTALIEGESLAGSSNQKQIKRLTKSEFAYKLSKGKCLKCDQNFTPEHRCASRTLQILLADKENENDGVANMDRISYNTLLGLYENYTTRLLGILGGEEIIVLIDCGASNNIISANVVQRLGIKVTDTVAIDLNLANGETISNKGICKGVVTSFPELQVVEDFLQLNMGNTRDFDVILGIQWLKTLGDVMVNWKLSTMTFGSETGTITLKGDPDLCSSSRVPAKSMEKSSKIIKNPWRKLQLFFYSKFCF